MVERVQRQVELDAPAEEVWRTVVDDDERAAWLGGPTELDARPGGVGHLDGPDGVRRRILVDHVEPERRLRFHWWTGDGDERSDVEIVLEPDSGRTRFTVTETRCAAGPLPSGPISEGTVSGRLLDLELLCLSRAALTVRA